MLYLQLVGSLVVLLGGGEALVRGAVGIASRFGVSPLVIGLTLVGFGTSLPELVASLEAVLLGAPGIALGNVIGSNIANVLLILGLAAIVWPLETSRDDLRRDGPVLLAASLVMVVLCFGSVISRLAGVVLVAFLAVYVFAAYVSGSRQATAASEAGPRPRRGAWRDLVLAVAGLVGVVVGASLLVDSAIVLARLWGVAESVIGLTIVAVGTSLPELATSLVAAWHRQSGIAFGNIVGSNIFNILGIVGVTAIVHPIAVPPEIAGFDVWVMLAVAVVLLVFAVTRWRIERWEGVVLLLGYGGYLAALV